KYACQVCGYESAKWRGKCQGSKNWNTLAEVIEAATGNNRHTMGRGLQTLSTAESITAIESEKEPRITTAMQEFNRVLGGGIVPGSLMLIGGDPGIGKSTLLLQISSQLAEKQL